MVTHFSLSTTPNPSLVRGIKTTPNPSLVRRGIKTTPNPSLVRRGTNYPTQACGNEIKREREERRNLNLMALPLSPLLIKEGLGLVKRWICL